MKKLAASAKFSEDVAKKWLVKQALWQVFLLAARYMLFSKTKIRRHRSKHGASTDLPTNYQAGEKF